MSAGLQLHHLGKGGPHTHSKEAAPCTPWLGLRETACRNNHPVIEEARKADSTAPRWTSTRQSGSSPPLLWQVLNSSHSFFLNHRIKTEVGFNREISPIWWTSPLMALSSQASQNLLPHLVYFEPIDGQQDIGECCATQRVMLVQ